MSVSNASKFTSKSESVDESSSKSPRGFEIKFADISSTKRLSSIWHKMSPAIFHARSCYKLQYLLKKKIKRLRQELLCKRNDSSRFCCLQKARVFFLVANVVIYASLETVMRNLESNHNKNSPSNLSTRGHKID